MARGAWISHEVRERIVQMRKDGASVKDIAELMERSTNYIYRILRQMNGAEPTKKKHKTAGSQSDIATAPILDDAPRKDAGERRDRLLEDFSDPSAAILCAVENMEMSAYEAIPMPKSVHSIDSLQPHAPVYQDAVSTSISFRTEATSLDKPHAAQTSNASWMGTDPSSSVRRSAEPKPKVVSSRTDQLQSQSVSKQTPSASKVVTQETSALQPSALTSSLLVNLHIPQTKKISMSSARDFYGGLEDLLKHIQSEIQRLQNLAHFDRYDAQMLQKLIKFHAEMQLLELKRTLSASELSKRGEGHDVDDVETNHLLRRKLSEEILLLGIKVDRERLELEREQIRHKTASMICRKTLLEANASPIDVDELFPRQ